MQFSLHYIVCSGNFPRFSLFGKLLVALNIRLISIFFPPYQLLVAPRKNTLSLIMVGRAKSETKKRQLAQEEHDSLMARAVIAYKIELTKRPGIRRRGARVVCKDFENLYLGETGKIIKLSFSTLTRLAAGGRTQAESNADRSWLTDGETKVVLDYTIEQGARGFGLSHRRLKEHVDSICRARLGSRFPEFGVGRQWTHRFVEKHTDYIKTSWARPLETIRGRAVNPNTNDAWYDILEDEAKTVDQDCLYAADEVGLQPNSGHRERVIGGVGPGPQYQQRDGNKENTTVIVVINADGSSPPPAIVFKGTGYQTKWAQDNPANAS
jgi:hypothetical protein